MRDAQRSGLLWREREGPASSQSPAAGGVARRRRPRSGGYGGGDAIR
ncbi:MAG: hypothetical protein IAE92_08565 [Burkholderiaceae bacterium]|nr:hypothetical protein [Burkholderiaceae bacterium]